MLSAHLPPKRGGVSKGYGGKMKTMKDAVETLMSIVLVLAVACLLVFLNSDARAAEPTIQISYKLDPRLTSGLYMGERWVSPPTYTCVQAGKSCTVEARAQGLDAKGKPFAISPEWIPEDPDMVTVSPRQGYAVKITVQRAGQTSLKVSSEGVSKELAIKAAYKGDTIQVEISPKPGGPTAATALPSSRKSY